MLKFSLFLFVISQLSIAQAVDKNLYDKTTAVSATTTTWHNITAYNQIFHGKSCQYRFVLGTELREKIYYPIKVTRKYASLLLVDDNKDMKLFEVSCHVKKSKIGDIDYLQTYSTCDSETREARYDCPDDKENTEQCNCLGVPY